MRRIVIVLAAVLVLSGAAGAQGPSAFLDVPPWHWAFDAVQEGAAAGIFIGYPTGDADQVANALEQVYAAFAHADHPAAQAWAELFLVNTPTAWPQPLRSSRLVRFRLQDVRVRVQGDRAAVSAAVTVTVRANGGTAGGRAALRVDAQKDSAGRWRIDYASLVQVHPQVFR